MLNWDQQSFLSRTVRDLFDAAEGWRKANRGDDGAMSAARLQELKEMYPDGRA